LLAVAVEREGPDGFSLVECNQLAGLAAAGVDLPDLALRHGAGVEGAVRGQGERNHGDYAVDRRQLGDLVALDLVDGAFVVAAEVDRAIGGAHRRPDVVELEPDSLGAPARLELADGGDEGPLCFAFVPLLLAIELPGGGEHGERGLNRGRSQGRRKGCQREGENSADREALHRA